MTLFYRVSDLNPDSLEGSASHVAFTLDLDWCANEILDQTLSIFLTNNVPVTVFATHSNDYIQSLSSESLIEIGIHPNFNPLMDGQLTKQGDSFRRRVDDLLGEFPSAKSVRSHSLVNAPRITQYYAECGLTHESNQKLEPKYNLSNRPLRSEHGIIHCPISWGDYSDGTKDFWIGPNPPKFFLANFHPIHLFLNSDGLDLYERTRAFHQSPAELSRHVNHGLGVRSRLEGLLANLIGGQSLTGGVAKKIGWKNDSLA